MPSEGTHATRVTVAMALVDCWANPAIVTPSAATAVSNAMTREARRLTFGNRSMSTPKNEM